MQRSNSSFSGRGGTGICTPEPKQIEKLWSEPFSRKAKITRYHLSDILFWILMLLVSVPDMLEIWGIDTIFKPYRVTAIILASIALPRIVHERATTRSYSAPLFIALAYVSIMTAVFAGLNGLHTAPLIISCLALFFAAYGATSRRSLVIGVYCSFASLGISVAWGFASTDSRLSGLFHNPNSMGYAACFVLLIAIGRHFSMTSWLRWSLIVISPLIVLASGSRGAFFAMLAMIVVQFWRKPKYLVFGTILLFAVATLFVAFSTEIQSLADGVRNQNPYLIQRYSVSEIERGGGGRLAIAKGALSVALDHGFVGIGLGQYRLKYHARVVGSRSATGELQHLGTHNLFVSLLTEWGFVGLLCFVVIFARLIQDAKKLPVEGDVIIGFCAISFVFGLTDDLLTEVHFWVMLGVCVQLIRYSKPTKGKYQSREQISKIASATN